MLSQLKDWFARGRSRPVPPMSAQAGLELFGSPGVLQRLQAAGPIHHLGVEQIGSWLGPEFSGQPGFDPASYFEELHRFCQRNRGVEIGNVFGKLRLNVFNDRTIEVIIVNAAK